MSRDYRLYLDDMRAAAEKVLRYTQGVDLTRFMDDEKTFDVNQAPQLLEQVRHILKQEGHEE